MAELDDPRPLALVVETSSTADGAPLIRVGGDLDIASVNELKAAVATALAEHPRTLTFELSGLRFMDSAGIAVLLDAVSRVETVRLQSPTVAVSRVIELTGLTGLLTVER
jgi:anti-sigma B factor antagonist